MSFAASSRPPWLHRAIWGVVLLAAVALGLAWVMRVHPSSAAAADGVVPLIERTPVAGDEAFRLAARCRQAMLLGQCSAMAPSAAASSVSAASSAVAIERVFVAGTGEVNASVYAAWRQQGQAMCEDVERQCRSEPQGAACRVAKALYAGMP